jgi:hypothetical protein
VPGRPDVPRRNREHSNRRGHPHPSLLHDAQGPDISREKSKDSVRILHKSTVGRLTLYALFHTNGNTAPSYSQSGNWRHYRNP